MEYKLGSIRDFEFFPVTIEIDNQAYFILRNDDGYILASRICPHMGYTVEINEGGGLVCFLHGWRFDVRNGTCVGIEHEKLNTYPISVKNEELVVSFDSDVN